MIAAGVVALRPANHSRVWPPARGGVHEAAIVMPTMLRCQDREYASAGERSSSLTLAMTREAICAMVASDLGATCASFATPA